MAGWVDALATFAVRAPGSLRWMLVGSAATAVHGVPVTPGDVDVLIHPETADDCLQEMAERLAAAADDAVGGSGLSEFVSSRQQPWTDEGTWTFGRWILDGARLEAARITDLTAPTTLVETQGQAVWSVARAVVWGTFRLHVVPLEVQLATSLSRGLDDRADLIRQHLRRTGLDRPLLRRALRGQQVTAESAKP